MRKASWLALVLGVLCGCGFQLQGRQALPATLSSLIIDAHDEQSPFTHALREAVIVSGGTLAPEGAQDVATVHILRDEVTETVLSVSSRNIPTDYELTYEVELEVMQGARKLLEAEEFELSRVYSFDERKLLAKEREKEVLVEALARDMASIVTRRLASL